MDPHDQAHLDAAQEQSPAHAAALRRHFADQRISIQALRVGRGSRIPEPRKASDC